MFKENDIVLQVNKDEVKEAQRVLKEHNESEINRDINAEETCVILLGDAYGFVPLMDLIEELQKRNYKREVIINAFRNIHDEKLIINKKGGFDFTPPLSLVTLSDLGRGVYCELKNIEWTEKETAQEEKSVEIPDEPEKRAIDEETENLVRSLCKNIFAKNTPIMKPGARYSKADMELGDLVNEAIDSFDSYYSHQKELMRKTIRTAEARLQIINDLEDELDALINNDRIVDTKEAIRFLKEFEKQRESERDDKNLIEAAHQSMEALSDLAKDINRNTGDRYNEPKNQHRNREEKISRPIHEEEFAESKEQKEFKETPQPSSMIRHEKQTDFDKNNVEAEFKNKINQRKEAELNEAAEDCDELMWAIIEIIGSEGVTNSNEIHKILQSEGFKKSRYIDNALKNLEAMEAVYKEMSDKKKGHWGSSKEANYILSHLGEDLYHKKTGSKAVSPIID